MVHLLRNTYGWYLILTGAPSGGGGGGKSEKVQKAQRSAKKGTQKGRTRHFTSPEELAAQAAQLGEDPRDRVSAHFFTTVNVLVSCNFIKSVLLSRWESPKLMVTLQKMKLLLLAVVANQTTVQRWVFSWILRVIVTVIATYGVFPAGSTLLSKTKIEKTRHDHFSLSMSTRQKLSKSVWFHSTFPRYSLEIIFECKFFPQKTKGVEALIEIENPNRVIAKSKKISELTLDDTSGAAAPQLTRRERFVHLFFLTIMRR